MTAFPWFYPDKVSAVPGGSVALHASSSQSPCELLVSRIGMTTEFITQISGIEIEYHPTPDEADREGCEWPEAIQITIGEDWKPGYYDLRLSAPDGSASHHFICVRRTASAPKADGVVILSTNTYSAYNYWGGRNSYAHVEGLMKGQYTLEEAQKLASGRVSRMRPYPQLMISPGDDFPRLINLEVRGPGELSMPGDLEWIELNKPSPYDGSAGFINKWEHAFCAWAERNGYELDYLTDHDFESGDESVLTGYNAVFVVGHSEYWSANQRNMIERYTKTGGNLAIFSGNTAWWKVRWEDDGSTLVNHKFRGETDDPLWADAATRMDGTHLWSHAAFGKPEAAVTGLSFCYGGYHRLFMCVARGAAAYTIYNDQHWALDGTDLFYGDLLGADIPLIGYENDGCPIRFGSNGLPEPDGGLGIPKNLEIIGFAPATLAESDRSPFPKMVPHEQEDVVARVALGSDSPESIDRLMRGHAVIASFKNEAGEVFNAGTTEWAHGLAANNPFIETITHNVFKRFGVRQSK